LVRVRPSAAPFYLTHFSHSSASVAALPCRALCPRATTVLSAKTTASPPAAKRKLGVLKQLNIFNGCQKLLLLWVYVGWAHGGESHNGIDAVPQPDALGFPQVSGNLIESSFQGWRGLIGEENNPKFGISGGGDLPFSVSHQIKEVPNADSGGVLGGNESIDARADDPAEQSDHSGPEKNVKCRFHAFYIIWFFIASFFAGGGMPTWWEALATPNCWSPEAGNLVFHSKVGIREVHKLAHFKWNLK
jgi:hypothetical protein